MRNKVTPCKYEDSDQPTRCTSQSPGHRVHHIQMSRGPQSPWNWRDGILRNRAEDGTIKVDYVNDDGTATLHHHAELDGGFPPGSPVRVHESYCLLASGRRALSVVVLDGLGEVPEPDSWEGTEYTSGVADWATGEGILIRRAGSGRG